MKGKIIFPFFMHSSLNQLIETHLQTLKDRGGDLVLMLNSEEFDTEAVRVLSHTIKGSSGSLGFRRYSELAAQIEADCKSILAGNEIQISSSAIEEFDTILTTLCVEDSEIYNREAI